MTNNELSTMNHNPIIIPVNKSKPVKYFTGSAVLTILGLLLIVTPGWFTYAEDPVVLKVIGYILVIFFGACMLLYSQRVFDKKPAMVLDEEGFTDYTSGVNTGKVLWQDVTGIFIKEGMGQQFIMLKVKDPEKYIEREKNPLKLRILQMNNRLYETPINISAKGMKISFEDLHQLLKERIIILNS